MALSSLTAVHWTVSILRWGKKEPQGSNYPDCVCLCLGMKGEDSYEAAAYLSNLMELTFNVWSRSPSAMWRGQGCYTRVSSKV